MRKRDTCFIGKNDLLQLVGGFHRIKLYNDLAAGDVFQILGEHLYGQIATCDKGLLSRIPPVLNFGPCLAIGRLEMVATALAKELNIDLPGFAQEIIEGAFADAGEGILVSVLR